MPETRGGGGSGAERQEFTRESCNSSGRLHGAVTQFRDNDTTGSRRVFMKGHGSSFGDYSRKVPFASVSQDL
jgi:hypothetical protein